MRELDLLFEKFLASGLELLEDDDLERMENLLIQPDQDILAWLTGAAIPEDANIHHIVTILRSAINLQSNACD